MTPSRGFDEVGTGILGGTTRIHQPIPESGGSRMTLQVTIQVRIPFIGGKLERLIGTQLSQLVTIEQRFTTLWITNNV